MECNDILILLRGRPLISWVGGGHGAKGKMIADMQGKN